jgi:8-oxo-dGTP pyrophosphatase MutT (NUDIX family)
VERFSDRDDDFVTFDGRPVNREPPHGATVVVVSESPDGWRYLTLHRAHRGSEYEGDWAWTPPAGARLPGEDVARTARRELQEETGLDGEPLPLRVAGAQWTVFELEVPWGCHVVVDGEEHDRYEWVSLEEACRRCLPAVVADALRLAAR